MIRILIPLLILFFALAANAQEAITISPIVSFDFGSPLFINRSPGVLNSFSGTATGTSSSESYGVGAQISIPDLIGRIGLVGQLEGVYNSGKFQFTSRPYTVSGIDRKLVLELGALWNVQPFAIRAGPWVSQSISRNVYENDPNGIQIASGNGIVSNATHVGLSAGIAWHIPSFPLQPELNSHLDLWELSQAGVNAWSVGISLTYHFGVNRASPTMLVSTRSEPERVETRSTPVPIVITPRVRFLVNGSEANGNPPLERVETRVKEYAMVDSPNVAPRVTQWAEESYRLPHLSLLCRFNRRSAGYLMILKDSLRLMEKYFGGIAKNDGYSDTTINLEADDSWNTILNHLNTNESNRLIAELRTNREQLSLFSDTLLLPPVDTTRAVETSVKKEARFVLSDDYNNFAGGQTSLELLLDKIRSLRDSVTSITVIESPLLLNSPKHDALVARIRDVLGTAWTGVRREVNSGSPAKTILLMKY